MTDVSTAGITAPFRVRIEEAQRVLASIGMPPAQQNTLAAVTLLALLDLRPDMAWSDVTNPLVRGTQPIMRFADGYYPVRDKRYAENTRETVRKDVLDYFVAAGFVVKNPDKPRKTNSPQTCRQVTSEALALFRSYGSDEWVDLLASFLEGVGSLSGRFDSRRMLTNVPLKVRPDLVPSLSGGEHSDLIEAVIREFGGMFTPGATLIYAGDTSRKWSGYFDEQALAALGVTIAERGAKMPDVVIYDDAREWLVLVEAYTTRGPINPLRKEELERLFTDFTGNGLVLVTAFADRRTMARVAGKIAWETEVWIATDPPHLIHFNGERFLGPPESEASSQTSQAAFDQPAPT